MQLTNLLIVGCETLPGLTFREWFYCWVHL
jgi:hypothetical protein